MCTSKAIYKKIIKNKNSELHKQNIKNINNVPETYICFISIMFVFSLPGVQNESKKYFNYSVQEDTEDL